MCVVTTILFLNLFGPVHLHSIRKVQFYLDYSKSKSEKRFRHEMQITSLDDTLFSEKLNEIVLFVGNMSELIINLSQSEDIVESCRIRLSINLKGTFFIHRGTNHPHRHLDLNHLSLHLQTTNNPPHYHHPRFHQSYPRLVQRVGSRLQEPQNIYRRYHIA